MKCVPVYAIRAAKESDTDAVRLIVQHFRRYIAAQCLIHCIGTDGHDRVFIDVDLRDQAVSALLSAIFSFRLKEPPSNFLAVKSPRLG